MLSYKQFLHEARKNPQLNPRISLYSALEKYIEDDVYVSFRNINKLGINPKSSYNTPNGIYCYRLRSYKWKFLDNENRIDKVFPFFGETTSRQFDKPVEVKKQLGADITLKKGEYKKGSVISAYDVPYVYVFEPKVDDESIIRLGNLTQYEVLEFIEKTINTIPEFKEYYSGILNETNEDVKYAIDTMILNPIEPYRKEFNSDSDEIESGLLDGLNSVLKFKIKSTIEGDDRFYKLENEIIDDVEELIYYIYELKDEFSDYKTLLGDQVETIRDGINEIVNKTTKYYDSLKKIDVDVEAIYDYCSGQARVKSEGGTFWNFSYNLYHRVPNKWSAFYRKLGIIGVDDSAGESIIHSNEPYQTVFFDKTKLKVLESILNKKYENVKIKTKKVKDNLTQSDYNVFFKYNEDEPYYLTNDKHEFYGTYKEAMNFKNQFEIKGIDTWILPTFSYLLDYTSYHKDLDKEKEYWIGNGEVFKDSEGYLVSDKNHKAYLRLLGWNNDVKI